MKKGGMPTMRSSESEGKPWGQGNFANMPQEVVIQDAGKNDYHMSQKLDDSMGRLAGDAKQESKGFRKNLDRGMY